MDMDSIPVSDLESQLEELTALGEILGSEFIRKETESELFGGTLHVNIWDRRYDFKVKYSSKLTRLTREEDMELMEKRFESFIVNHLPPVELTFSFPLDYPSASMPKFMLKSTWLHEKTMTNICKELNILWDQYKGTGIIYQWYSYLKNEAYKLIRMQNSEFCIDFILCQQLAKQGYPLLKLVNCVSDKFRDFTFVEELCGRPNGGKRYLEAMTGSKEDGAEASSKGSLKKVRKKGKSVDPRVVFELVDKQFISYLQMYDDDQDEIIFQSTLYDCPVCFCEKRGVQCFRFLCGHAFCLDCVNQCFHIHIQSGQLEYLKCMAFKCDQPISYGDLKHVVAPADFERYESLQLQRNLEQEHSVATCPRKKCQAVAFGEKDDTLTICSKCNYSFCSVCKKSWHGLSYCYDLSPEEQKKIYELYKCATPEEKLELERKYGKRLLDQVGSEIESRDWLKENSKACPNPSCLAPIEKFDGCNKMICTKCNTLFCWLCANILDEKNPYAHFNDPESSCNQRLHEGNNTFDPEEPEIIFLPAEEVEGAGIRYEDIAHLMHLEGEDDGLEEPPEWDVNIGEDLIPFTFLELDPEDGVERLMELLLLHGGE